MRLCVLRGCRSWFDRSGTRCYDGRDAVCRPRARPRPRDGRGRSPGRRPRARRRRLGPRPAARPDVEGRRRRGLRRRGGGAAGDAGARSAASRRSARASRSTRSARSTSRCPAASRRSAGATAGSSSRATPRCRWRRPPAGATSRSTPSRGTPCRTSTSIPAAAAPISRPASSAWSIARRSPTTACASCGRCSSSPGSSCRPLPETVEICRAIPLDDLPAERIWAEFEKLLLLADAPVDRLRVRARRRHRRPPAARDGGARRVRAGAGVAPGGRRLGAHAHGHRRVATPHRRPAPVGEGGRDARRRVPRLRQAVDHRVLRRPDSGRTTTRRPASPRPARCSTG